MSTEIKFRRGTQVEHQSFTGAIGEITVDTTNDSPVVHDGVKVGGHSVELKAIARSLNILDSDVGYDNAGLIVKDYIYSASQQVIYSVPASAIGKTISSVVGSTLNTTDLAAYQLKKIELSIQFNSVSEMKSVGFTDGVIVKTRGYYDNGDSGGAEYLIQTSLQYNGIPDEFGDHTLDNGNIAKIIVDGAIDSRCFGTNGSNDLGSMDSAMEIANHVLISSPVVIEGTLKLTKAGLIISGEGTTRLLYGSHIGSPILEVLNRKIVLRDFKISTTGARLAGNYDVNGAGILIGGVNQVSIPTNSTLINLDISSNPGDGIYFSGDAVGSTVENCAIQLNRGHGVRLDDGTSLSQVQLRAGTIGIKNCVIKDNGGHAIAMRPEGGGSCYRIEALNNDIGDNCWNETEIGYAVDHHILCQGQNLFLRQNAYNNDDFSSTTLGNGRNKYARAEPCSGVLFKGGTVNQACTSLNDRILTAKYGFEVQDANDSVAILRPFAGAAVIDAFVNLPFSSPTMTNLQIDVPSVGALEAISGTGLNQYSEFIVGGERTVNILTGRYILSKKTSSTIAGGGLRIDSDIIEMTGAGGVADSVSFLKPGLADKPLRDGDFITLLNNNVYDISVDNSTVEPSIGLSPIKTRTGSTVVLTTGSTFTGRVVGGFLMEV